MATIYRIKISNGELSVEAEGDKKFVSDTVSKYFTEEKETSLKHGGSNKTKSKTEKVKGDEPNIKALSVGEFIRQLGVKKHTDYVMAFGYYLEKFQGVSDFTPADINNCYYDAKMESSNTSQMIIQNIKRGFLMEAKADGNKGKNRYTLTSSGLSYVDKQLSTPVLE